MLSRYKVFAQTSPHLKLVAVALALVSVGEIASNVLNLSQTLGASAQTPPASPSTVQPAASLAQQMAAAKQHYRRAQFKKAIEQYQQILSIATQTTDQEAQWEALWHLYDMDLATRHYAAAETKIRQFLQLAQQVKHRAREAQGLAGLSALHRLQGNYPQALDHAQKAVEMAQQAGDRRVEARSHFMLGIALYHQPDYARALAALQQALQLAQADEKPDEEALILNWVALTQSALKEGKQAEATIQQQQDLSRRIGLTLAEYYGLSVVAAIQQRKQQPALALPAYQKALAIAQTADNPWFARSTMLAAGLYSVTQGTDFFVSGAYKQAIAAYDTAIPLLKPVLTLASDHQQPEQERQAITLLRLAYLGRGWAFNSQQFYPEAIAAFEQTLTFWRQQRDRLDPDTFLEEEQGILSILAGVYFHGGQYTQAIAVYEQALQVAQQRQDVKKQLFFLNLIAVTYNRLGDHHRALAISQQQLALAREKLNQDPEAEISALLRVGLALGELGNTDAELQHYQRALTLARSRNLPESEASALHNMSTAYRSQGEYLQALEPLQQVLATRRQAIQRLESGEVQAVEQLCSGSASLGAEGRRGCLQRFHIGLTQVLNNLGLVYESLGRYTEALQTYGQALEIALQYRDVELQTTLLNNLGTTHLRIGNYPRALESFQQSRQLALATGDRPSQAVGLNNLGQVYNIQGQTAKALDFFQQSLALAKALPNPNLEATALLNLGSVYSDRGEHERALGLYQQALAIERQHNLGSVITFNNIANAYLHQGRYDQAVAQLQQALDMARQTGDRPGQILLLQHLGAVHREQANYAEALGVDQQAEQLSQTTGSRSDQLSNLLVQGHSHRELGQYSQALDRYQQALTLSRELGERQSEIGALRRIGDVYRQQAQYSQAAEWYQRALHLSQVTGNDAEQQAILVPLAQIDQHQGKLAAAEDVLQKALAFSRHNGARPAEARILNSLGQVYTAQGKDKDAQDTLQQALAIAQSINARTTVAETLAALGNLFKPQPQLAIAFYKQAVNTYEGIRTGIRSLSSDQQDAYTQAIATTYRQLADLLIAQGRLAEAQQVLELLKIQELNDYEGIRSTANLTDVQLNEIEAKILQEHTTLIAFIQKLNECHNCPEQAQLFSQAEALREQYHRTVKALAEKSKQDRADDQSFLDPNSRFGALAQEILRKQPGTVILYPLVLPDKIWILMASEGGLLTRYEVKVDQTELNQTVFELRTLLQSPNSDRTQLNALSQKLYGWLVQPLESELKTTINGDRQVKHLVFALDRVTRYLPMSALFDGQHYLIEDYTVSTIIGAGQTNYSDRLPAAIAQTPILGVGLSEAKANFSALPSVPSELDAIVKQGDHDPGIYPGQEFLNQAFSFNTLQQHLKDKQILHIATHGEFLPGRAHNSYLLLGTGDKLTIPDIARLQFLGDVHMVVLSACQTALGGTSDGVEISGVSDFFFRQGVRTVLATLWNVNDASTALMMQQFYNHLATGKTKAEALRQTQLSLLQGKLTAQDAADFDRAGVKPYVEEQPVDSLAHPYYWAPFILIGNSL